MKKRLFERSLLTVIVLSCMFVSHISFAQKRIKNQFFTLHNIIRGDSVYNTFDKQVALIKATGFDAVEINQIPSFDGMMLALNKNKFKGAYFYIRVSVEPPYTDPRLKDYILQLKGSGVIISPALVSDAKLFKPSSHNADSIVVREVGRIADWAQEAGLQVAIYPHYGFYLERTDHTLDLVRQINRPNVGLTFNLCHWLATTTLTERSNLHAHLRGLLPYLKMVTISGANDVISHQKSVWDDYILPLGNGSFDTYGLIKYLVQDLKFTKPIGVQCYDIKGDKPALVSNTMQVWKTYRAKLEGGK